MEEPTCYYGSQEWFDAYALVLNTLAPGVLFIVATAVGVWLLCRFLLR